MKFFTKSEQPYQCFLSVFLSLFIVSFVSGCATPNISKQTQLNPNEGILLTKVHANLAGIQIFVYDEATIWPKVTIATLESLAAANQPIENLRAVAIEGGKLFFGKIQRGYEYVKLERQYFNIVPGAINYVGDIYINWTSSFWGGYMQMRFVDAEEKTINEAKEKFPWLFDKYRYVKNLPEVKIETVPGFHETKELKELKEKENGLKDNAEKTDTK